MFMVSCLTLLISKFYISIYWILDMPRYIDTVENLVFTPPLMHFSQTVSRHFHENPRVK